MGDTPECISCRAADQTVQAFPAGWVYESWPRNFSVAAWKGYAPTTLPQLANAVLQAEAAGHHVRAFGAKWSFSDAVRAAGGGTPSSTPAPGAMIDTKELGSSLQEGIEGILADGVNPDSLFHVEAGITCVELNELLDRRPTRQKLTSGGGSGQTLGGLISTSTHSAECTVGTIGDSVQAIHLVGAGGVEHWFERDTAITTRARLHARYPCLQPENIHYSSLLFNAVLVSAGSMGVIYSVIIATVPQIGILQHRVSTTWEELIAADPMLDGVIDGSFMAGKVGAVNVHDDTVMAAAAPFTPNEFAQIVLNTYPFDAGDATLSAAARARLGRHSCFVTNHVPVAVPLRELRKDPVSNESLESLGAGLGVAARQTLGSNVLDFDARFIALGLSLSSVTDVSEKAIALVNMLADHYDQRTIGGVINYVLKHILPIPDRSDVATRMSEVVSWGQSIRSFCVEAAFSVPGAIAFVPKVFALVAKYAAPSTPAGTPQQQSFVGGYLALRIVGKKTNALLGMQRWSPTCCVEYLGLARTHNIEAFVTELEELALTSGGILHWGLQNEAMTSGDVRRVYTPDAVDTFRRVRGILSDRGRLTTFDNTFTQRFGLTALNGLVFTDEQGQRLDVWDARPLRGSQLIEHTATRLNGIGLVNEYTDRAVRVTGVRITSTGDATGAPAFTVLSRFPFYVDAGQTSFVDVEYAGSAPGSLTGMLEVDCDDPIEPTLRIPLAVTIQPIGPSAALQIAPTPMDLGATPVGATVGANLTITNVGVRDAIIDSISLMQEQPAGQFAFPGFASTLAPGQSDTLYVSCTPTFMGAAAAVLRIEIQSETAAGQRVSTSYEVPLAAVGQQPTIVFAGGPIGRRPRPTPPLQLLEFGAGPPDTDLTATFWIRNSGNAALEVGALHENVSFTVPDAASRFPAVIRPGGELEVPCAYRTSAVPGQTTTATLRFLTNDPANLTAHLSGRAAADGPHLSVPPEFERTVVLVGPPPAATTAVFRSDGTTPISVAKLIPRGGEFQVTADPPLPASLPPGTELTLTITTSAQTPTVEDYLALYDGNSTEIPRSRIKLRSV